MKTYFGLLDTSSEKTSNEYLEVNNFGYYEKLSFDMNVNRPKGRVDYQIIYLFQGKGEVHIDGNLIKLDGGSILLFRPGEIQKYRFFARENTSVYWIHFTGVGAEELLTKMSLTETIYSCRAFYSFRECIRKMSDMSAIKNYAADRQRSGALMTLIGELSVEINTPHDDVLPAVRHIQQTPEAKMDNSQYAKMCNMSEYHFIRKFKAYTGTSPHAYKTGILISKASQLLTATNMNIIQISEMLGFENSLYFSRVFRKETGLSPRAFRNASKADT